MENKRGPIGFLREYRGPFRMVKTSRRHSFGIFRHPVRAVGCYSSGPSVAGGAGTESTGGLYHSTWFTCSPIHLLYFLPIRTCSRHFFTGNNIIEHVVVITAALFSPYSSRFTYVSLLSRNTFSLTSSHRTNVRWWGYHVIFLK